MDKFLVVVGGAPHELEKEVANRLSLCRGRASVGAASPKGIGANSD